MESIEYDDNLYELAIAEYCTHSERDGFLYSIDNGCSLEKSNSYCAGFINGFQESYKYQQSCISDLKSENSKLKEALDQIYQVCGTVNFSSHNQMRESIEYTIDLSQQALNANNNL